MDLVIQSADLSSDAVVAFKVACVARRARRGLNSARLAGIQDDADTRKAAAALARHFRCDAAFVLPTLRLADFRLLALDMDSTLVNVETLDEIAALARKGAEVAAITEAAMHGEIADYKDSLRRRVAILAGADAALLERVYDDKLRLAPGAAKLIARAKEAGLKTLLVTSGFSFFAQRLQARLGLDFTCANELDIVDGRLTGKVRGPAGGEIVDAGGKAQALRDVCASLGCATAAAIAIGDGANDLQMMKLAGLAVAYRAKPLVRAQADQVLEHSGLDAVLNWFV